MILSKAILMVVGQLEVALMDPGSCFSGQRCSYVILIFESYGLEGLLFAKEATTMRSKCSK